MNLPSIVHHSSSAAHGHGHYGGGHRQAHQYTTQPHAYASRPPAPPPSPPVEDNAKCSLPSISTLLVYADGAQPHSNDSIFEGGNSPTLASTPPSNYYYSAPVHGAQSHRNSYPPAHQKSVYPSPTESSYSAQHGYYSPQPSDSYNKQPQLMVPVSVAPPSSANPWHHHHHQSPASHAAFPQSQDRYICPTCNKAFSRPSSLRIHSHSHTGEKPFKCPHHGCGKAFSVRSNMKRHERGCHQ